MKTKILDALKPKFEGVSDAILERIATKLAKTVKTEDDVTTAVEGVTFQQVLESYGDSRATEAAKTAVKNYETQHKLKDGKKVDDVEPNDDGKKKEGDDNTDVPEWAKEFIEANKRLKEELDTLKGEKTSNTRKTALTEVIKGLPTELQSRYEKDFARLNFKDDDDFNSWLEDTKKDVEGINVKMSAFSSPLGGQFGNKDEHGVSKLVKDKFAEAKAQAEKQPSAISGL